MKESERLEEVRAELGKGDGTAPTKDTSSGEFSQDLDILRNGPSNLNFSMKANKARNVKIMKMNENQNTYEEMQ